MLFPSTRVGRFVLGSALLVACSDGARTTEPTRGRAFSSGERARSADVITATTITPTTLYACYVPDKGTMYRIKTSDTPADCDKKDVQFSWTDHGSGPISGLIFASAVVTMPVSGRYFASCPTGKSVISFGYEIPVGSTATTSQIRGNRPTLANGQALWVFVATTGTDYVFYWTCGDADTPTAAE